MAPKLTRKVCCGKFGPTCSPETLSIIHRPEERFVTGDYLRDAACLKHSRMSFPARGKVMILELCLIWRSLQPLFDIGLPKAL